MFNCWDFQGGPCGVLAAVQAFVLRNLIFGSQFCPEDDEELPLSDVSTLFSNEPSAMRTLTFRRTRALVSALAEILWRCGKIRKKEQQQQQQNERKSSGGLGDWDFRIQENDEASELVVCFSRASFGYDLRAFDRLVHLKNYTH